jgi:hypothetical protein
MASLSELDTTSLMSSICDLCDLQQSMNVMNYADSTSMTDEQLIELRPVLIKYRDELLTRIGKSEYLIDTANMMQLYYRLVSALRSLDKYLSRINSDLDVQRLTNKLEQDLLNSYSTLAVNNLQKD